MIKERPHPIDAIGASCMGVVKKLVPGFLLTPVEKGGQGRRCDIANSQNYRDETHQSLYSLVPSLSHTPRTSQALPLLFLNSFLPLNSHMSGWPGHRLPSKYHCMIDIKYFTLGAIFWMVCNMTCVTYLLSATCAYSVAI